jgi:Na+-translocating ferredoxin:NAD+ oxidoreductase RnfC subunit
MMSPCPLCACIETHPAHAILAALREDDIDAAIERGLLDAQPCPCCEDRCSNLLIEARDSRLRAVAARERFRAREARLARRAAERDAARTNAARQPAALPPAAAAALARAKAKATGRPSR